MEKLILRAKMGQS